MGFAVFAFVAVHISLISAGLFVFSGRDNGIVLAPQMYGLWPKRESDTIVDALFIAV